jgi:hypothetical protein
MHDRLAADAPGHEPSARVRRELDGGAVALDFDDVSFR